MTGVVEVVTMAVSAIASAAAPVAAAATAASPWITGGMALASAGLQISSAREQSVALQTQATQAGIQAQQQDLAARQEMARGQMAANRVREDLLRTLSAQNARYGASGLALEGSFDSVQDDTRRVAEDELTILRSESDARAAAIRSGAAGQRIQATLLQDRADSAQTAGIIGASTSLFDYVDRVQNRAPGRRTAPQPRAVA
jgi:hypothetical protein